jgi:NTP pyrophosphatase (non-canonical NTP hydrolase)
MVIKTFSEYQTLATELSVSLDKFRVLHPDLPKDVMDILELAYDGLGLGESGEVQGKIKKIIRDKGGVIDDETLHEIAKELGDNLWYIADMCDLIGISLEEVATMNIEKLHSRHARGTVHGSGDNR